MPDSVPPLVWRVPPYQAALLFLLVSGGAALNIYGHPAATVRAVTIVLSLAAFFAAVAAARMYLVVDDEGIGVRRILRNSSLTWSELKEVQVVSAGRGTSTIRFARRDGTYLDVPPNLLQPSKPSSKPSALARLHGVAGQIKARAEQHRA